MDGWLADLIAFIWWQHDRESSQAPAQPQPPHDPKVPKAWNAVVREWEPDERTDH